MNPKILLIYTGGTIGMTKLANKEILQPFNFDSLLKKIPELKLLQCEIETISFEPPIDSSNIGPITGFIWQNLLNPIMKRIKDL